MVFGIDIDGVLTDIEHYQLEIGGRFFKNKYHIDPVDPAGYEITDIFGMGKRGFYAFWSRHLFSYARKERSREGARQCLTRLADDGHSLHIITKRAMSDWRGPLGMLMRFIVRRWLKREGIPYDSITYCSGNKLREVRQFGVDAMIDDSPRIIRALMGQCDIICFDAAYNRDITGEGIYHAGSWDEVYDVCCRLREAQAQPV